MANRITVARIMLIPIMLFFLLSESLQPVGSWLAAALFVVAALTDTVDGYVARWQKQVTVFGKFLDPVADKLLVTSALVGLVQLGELPAWIVILIIAREFFVSGLRLVAVAEGKIVAASVWGKLKTVSQVVLVVALIINLNTRLFQPAVIWVLAGIAIALTMFSGFDYLLMVVPHLGLVPEDIRSKTSRASDKIPRRRKGKKRKGSSARKARRMPNKVGQSDV